MTKSFMALFNINAILLFIIIIMIDVKKQQKKQAKQNKIDSAIIVYKRAAQGESYNAPRTAAVRGISMLRVRPPYEYQLPIEFAVRL